MLKKLLNVAFKNWKMRLVLTSLILGALAALGIVVIENFGHDLVFLIIFAVMIITAAAFSFPLAPPKGSDL